MTTPAEPSANFALATTLARTAARARQVDSDIAYYSGGSKRNPSREQLAQLVLDNEPLLVQLLTTPPMDEATRIITQAARLIAPEPGEAVLTVRVGGSHTHCAVRAAPDVDPRAALVQAIKALRAELDNRPTHNQQDTPAP